MPFSADTTVRNDLLTSTTQQIARLEKKLNTTDTLYIEPNHYNLTLMLEQSAWYQRYTVGSYGTSELQSISMSPKANIKVGLYGGWRWIFFGYTVDISQLFKSTGSYTNRKEFVLNLYTALLGVDIGYRKMSNDFKIKDYNNFTFSPEDKYRGTRFDGMSARIFNFGSYWIFNHKRFSYPAAYSQSTIQRKSAGSFLAGLYYSHHNIGFDYTQLPSDMAAQMHDELKIQNIKFSNYTASFGYTYNWVFAKNWLLNATLMPAVGYKASTVDGVKLPYKNRDLNVDLIMRAGLVWNNTKYYAGASFIMETYDYRKQNFSMTNTFGTLRVYVGFNFWKKK